MVLKEDLYLINNYADFQCMQGRCPHTCCKNWIISIDDNTRKLMDERASKGTIRDKILLKLSMHYENNGTLAIRKLFGTCPYYTREGLCGHEKCGDIELMPLICRMYPRRVVQLGSSRIEVTMELSCFAAALWFINHPGKPTLFQSAASETGNNQRSETASETGNNQRSETASETENNPKSEMNNRPELEVLWTKNNDAPSYLEFLIKLREIAINELMTATTNSELLSVMNSQYKRICNIQSELMRHTIDGEVLPELMNLFFEGKEDTQAGIVHEEDVNITHDAGEKASDGRLLIPFVVLNRIIYQCFDEKSQKIKNPVFYKLLKKYDRLFGKEDQKTAELKFFDLLEKNRGYHNSRQQDLLYARYMSYCLMEEIPEAYEDYYLIGKYIFSAFYTELWMLFDVVNGSDQTDALQEADILSAFERAFRHSPSLKKNILAIIRQDFLRV